MGVVIISIGILLLLFVYCTVGYFFQIKAVSENKKISDIVKEMLVCYLIDEKIEISSSAIKLFWALWILVGVIFIWQFWVISLFDFLGWNLIWLENLAYGITEPPMIDVNSWWMDVIEVIFFHSIGVLVFVFKRKKELI